MNKLIYIFLAFFYVGIAYSESSVKAGKSLIWDSENKSYTANGNVEFQNDKFIAYADKMIARYVEKKIRKYSPLLNFLKMSK